MGEYAGYPEIDLEYRQGPAPFPGAGVPMFVLNFEGTDDYKNRSRHIGEKQPREP